mgnify:CR=1 FL=1
MVKYYYHIIIDWLFTQFEEDSETSAEPSQENIEDKLIKLESLYHQGLITQKEYDSKRKEILDRL